MPQVRESPAQQYQRYRRLLAQQPLPAALVDLDAVDANLARMLAPVRAAGRTLRLATKSVRVPDLLRYLVDHSQGTIRGLMTYCAAETAFLAQQGHDDLLLAYPTARPHDAQLLAQANRTATAAVVVDDVAQLAVLDRAATDAKTLIPVVIELDLAYRLLGQLHLGVRRSPLRDTAAVVELAEQLAKFPSLRLHGLMGYEAHVAGLTDRNPFTRWSNLGKRLLKRRAIPDIARRRADVLQALQTHGFQVELFNGGGTGSLASSLADSSLTEVTAGSGFLGSLLFDAYAGQAWEPALCFVLQLVRRPAPGIVTCHGGGFVASGEAGPDKLPRPWLPEQLELLDMEGAGEVQTPLRHPAGVKLELGDPVFFRHAKAGELAEHFGEYLLVRGEAIEARAQTYRGLGQSFLG